MTTESTWRKSSFSNAQSACVEATHASGSTGVRDSKNTAGGELWFSTGVFDAFTQVITADRPHSA